MNITNTYPFNKCKKNAETCNLPCKIRNRIYSKCVAKNAGIKSYRDGTYLKMQIEKFYYQLIVCPFFLTT